MAKNVIKRDAILSWYFEQKTANLVSVHILRTRDLSPYFKGLFVNRILPNGTCIHCIYVGDKHIPFSEIKRYGSATWRALESKLNQVFEIEQEPDAKQESLELVNQEATE